MKRFYNILLLVIFVNFTALPSLAMVFGWDLPTATTNVSEEEVKNNFASFNEKIPPKPFNFNDVMEVLPKNQSKKLFLLTDDSIHLSPYISIFSPPPEA